MPALDDALAQLPIFPLPDVVLFPGTTLPLQVFEPRYLEMTRDVLAGARLMAIVRLRPGFESDYHGRPPVEAVATVGEVVASQDIPGGRIAILVRGLERIAIERELAPLRSYRQVSASRLPDEDTDEPAMGVERGELVALCDQVAARLAGAGAGLLDLVHQGLPTAALTFALAAALVAAPAERQALLETRSPAVRVARLIDHVAGLLPRLRPAPSASN